MSRTLSIIGLIICIAALGAAYFLEYEYMLAPCPLCVLQRVIFYALGALCLVGSIFNLSKIWGYIYAVLIYICALAGLGLAGRQIWLQYFAPPQDISCSASLSRLIDLYPILDALKMAIVGSGECSEIEMPIFGLSIAVWSCLIFALFFAGSIYIFFEQKKRRI